MKEVEIKLYGRSRFHFAKAFPEATFKGYECNIRYCYFKIRRSLSDIKNICANDKITILEIA